MHRKKLYIEFAILCGFRLPPGVLDCVCPLDKGEQPYLRVGCVMFHATVTLFSYHFFTLENAEQHLAFFFFTEIVMTHI